MKEIELLIAAGITHLPDFRSKVVPHFKPELIENESARRLIQTFVEFHDKYKTTPTKEAMSVELSNRKDLSDDSFKSTSDLLDTVYSEKIQDGITKQSLSWMLTETERHLTNRACYNTIMESLSIIEGENKKLAIDAIPDLFKQAISISFDTNVGHDYIEDSEERFNFYHMKEDIIPFHLSMLNKATGGGMRSKSLIVPIAPTGVGKSLFLTSEAAHQLMRGKNVLYITLEMAEERISERIDAKLMDIAIGDLKTIPKSVFDNKINTMKKNPIGKIITKEYPPGTFTANHLRFLLNELKSKRNFIPKIIMVDYLNLMASYRMKDAGNSYSYVKAVAEELRGVGMEFDVTVISPTQTNRNGMGAADFELTEISESAGIAMTADLIFGIISTPEMEELGQLRFKQLKNRWGDLNSPNSWLVGVNRAKMQMFDLDMSGGNPTPTQPLVTQKTLNSQSTKPKGLKV